MPPIRVRKRPLGAPLRDSSGFPDTFRKPINRHWIQKRKAPVLDVLLENESEEEWVELGTGLVEELLGLGTFVALYTEGEMPITTLLDWTRTATARGDSGVVDLRWRCPAYPDDPVPVQGTTWCVIQAATSAGWLRSLWRDTGSETFNRDTELLLAVYDTDVSSSIPPGQHATLPSFAATLEQSVGWLTVLDEQIGFVVSVPTASSLHKRLTAGRTRGKRP